MIRAQEAPATLTIDVAGPATMTESPAVLATADEQVSRGVRSIRFDLRDCTVMDSTFSGTLLSLQRKLDRVGGTLTLVSPSRRVLDLLHDMGLDDFYAMEFTERPAGRWTRITTTRPGASTLQRCILDAHEELAQVPGPAGREFGRVVEALRDDARADAPPLSQNEKNDGGRSHRSHLN